jgi:hypothetical protein
MGCLPRQFTLAALLAFASGAALGEPGMTREHIAELGLQPRSGTVTLPADLAFGGEATRAWQSSRSPDYTLYAGSRATSRLGLRSDESYGGIVYSLPRGWGSSLEAGYAQESLLAPRRYALTGQLHTAFSEGRTLSVGLKYRVYDTDSSLRYGAAFDTPAITNGYTLAPAQHYGAGYAPSYQLQMSYQHSLASSFGVALGRDVETFTPFHDPSISGPRQFMFTGQHWLTPSWALSYDVLSQDAATPLRSLGLRFGVRYRW